MSILRPLSFFLIFVLLSCAGGCYSLKTGSKGEITMAEKTAFIIHSKSSFFKLNSAVLADGKISGLINYSSPETAVKNTVHIYVAPDSAIKKSGMMVEIPLENIAKVEVPTVDAGKTLIYTVGVVGGAAATILLIAWITKGASCPFIYEDNGSGYSFSGEIYSGATAVPLERDDYLLLPGIREREGMYSIKITNEVEEIQNTNLTELIIADHKPGEKILIDKKGNMVHAGHLISPASAFNVYGTSVLGEIKETDTRRYLSQVKNDEIYFDTITLKFPVTPGAKSGVLSVKGKNTMWLDYAFGQFSDLFGNRYEKWKATRNTKTQEELKQNSLDQGMPLKVFIAENGTEKFIDYFDLAGPMADREQVMTIDLRDFGADTLTVKLTSGILFWEYDRVAISYSEASPVKIQSEKPVRATDENGKDVIALLANDDDKYLVQPSPGNAAELFFKAPELQNGMERTVFLHSKGHYEILRKPEGKPDISYLRTFNNPGAFARFSKEKFLNIRVAAARN